MQVFCHVTAHDTGDDLQAHLASRRVMRVLAEPSRRRRAGIAARSSSQKSTRPPGDGGRRPVHKSPDRVLGLAQWLLASCLVLWPLRAFSLEISEPGSGQRFASPLAFAGKTHTLVGTGLRRQDGGASYAMALYVEDGARQSFPAAYDRGNRTRAGLFAQNRAHNFFIWGHFSKLAVLRFLRGHSRQELQRQFSEPLAELLTEKTPPELRQDTLTFLGLVDADLREGQELRLYTDDVGQIDIYIDGTKKAGPQNPKLARYLWEIWLGFHPVQPQMRQSLLERLDVLAQLPRPEKPTAPGKASPAAKSTKYPPLRPQ